MTTTATPKVDPKVVAASDATTLLKATLDNLAPDDMTAEDCVYVIAGLTKGSDSLTTLIKDVVGLLEFRLAELVPPKQTMAIGGYSVKQKKGSPTYKNWDSERLLMDVLDSRRFDPATGELIDESPAEKLQHVYSVSGSTARKTALKERGMNPADYCEVDRRDTVEVT